MSKDAETIKAELSKPFAPEDLEWRLQQSFEDKGRGLAGPENWHNEFKPWHGNGKKEAQICGISIYFEGRGFVTKWDGAEDTDIEAVKGGLSDSMKRAAVQWGIGRVLYKMDVVWVDIEKRGRSWIIKDSERGKLDMAYMTLLKKLKLAPAQPGGLKAELTPQTDGATPKQEKKQQNPAPAQPQQPAEQTPPAGKVTQMPTAQPLWEYTVETVNVQTGMSQVPTTTLTLKGRDGKTLKAFARGMHAGLVPGAQLCEVMLTMKQQNSVAFYVLNSFKLVNAMPQAA